VLRSSTSAEAYAPAIRALLRDIVAEPPLASFTTLAGWLDEEFADIRFQTALFGIFAAVAVLLAGVGLYGVIASGVARRTHEIGVRMALGAGASQMLRQVIASGVRLALVGTLIGAPLALLLARGMESMLFGVSTIDLPTLLATAVLLNGVCIVACFLPARRASRVPPLEAMRQ
jgi:ABC-type antimicrobial peptide transport system permease subunit